MAAVLPAHGATGVEHHSLRRSVPRAAAASPEAGGTTPLHGPWGEGATGGDV